MAFVNERSPPVKEGDVLEVHIVSVGAKGDGVAKKDGFVIFVPGAKEKDNVRVKIKRVMPTVAMAQIVESGGPVSDVSPVDSETFGEE